MKLSALLTMVAIGTGCTHYVSSPAYGPRAEVGRRLVGSPQIEEVTSSSMSAGFAAGGATYNNGYGYGASAMAGGLSGQAGTVKRTHCVQQAQIDYVEPVQFMSHVEGRSYDVAGSLLTGLVGLSIIGAGAASYSMAQDNYASDLMFYQMDPSFFPKPTEPSPPNAAYVIGGAAIVGAAAWLVYSLTSLPHGQPAELAPQQHAWTETTYVEAQGCGLVPGDRPTMP